MNRLRFIKGKALPIAVLVSALLFVPHIGVSTAQASIQDVKQQGTITGRVIDNTGEGVIGATVQVEDGSAQGTVTDFDGNFTINVKPGTKLKISYVGFESQVVAAKDGMVVTMAESSNMLNAVEVVVHARGRIYYKRRRHADEMECRAELGEEDVLDALDSALGVVEREL